VIIIEQGIVTEDLAAKGATAYKTKWCWGLAGANL
jgi:hypothetical protein